MRTNQSLQVWEHGVLMRERLIYRECGAWPLLADAGVLIWAAPRVWFEFE
jgi:hypothetical protein